MDSDGKEPGAGSVGVISVRDEMIWFEMECDYCGVGQTLALPVTVTLRHDPTPGLNRIVATYSFVRVSASTEHVCTNDKDAKDVDEAKENTHTCRIGRNHCALYHDTSQPTTTKAHFASCLEHGVGG